MQKWFNLSKSAWLLSSLICVPSKVLAHRSEMTKYIRVPNISSSTHWDSVAALLNRFKVNLGCTQHTGTKASLLDSSQLFSISEAIEHNHFYVGLNQINGKNVGGDNPKNQYQMTLLLIFSLTARSAKSYCSQPCRSRSTCRIVF